MNFYLIMFCCVLIVACVMENIRQRVTKQDKIKEWIRKVILWLCGFTLSGIIVVMAIMAFSAIMGEISVYKWLFYTIIVYFLQKDATLEVLKPIINKLKDRV